MKGFLILLAAVAGAVGGLVLIGYLVTKFEAHRLNANVESSCRERVGRYLKFPADAEWKLFSVSPEKDGHIDVSGQVLAPNAFGVRDTIEFSCDVLAATSSSAGVVMRLEIEGEEMYDLTTDE